MTNNNYNKSTLLLVGLLVTGSSLHC